MLENDLVLLLYNFIPKYIITNFRWYGPYFMFPYDANELIRFHRSMLSIEDVGKYNEILIRFLRWIINYGLIGIKCLVYDVNHEWLRRYC